MSQRREELEGLEDSVCLDFLYFRRLLAGSRSFWDDNINHRLNEIDVARPESCRALWESLQRAHSLRLTSIQRCIRVLEERIADNPSQPANPTPNQTSLGDGLVLRKEIGLLQSELTVEEVVIIRTMERFRSKCRHF